MFVFRVVQEALQNAIKYSRASKVSVHLSGVADGLALTIVDDGVGFDVDTSWGKGLGLISMGERLDAIGWLGPKPIVVITELATPCCAR